MKKTRENITERTAIFTPRTKEEAKRNGWKGKEIGKRVQSVEQNE